MPSICDMAGNPDRKLPDAATAAERILTVQGKQRCNDLQVQYSVTLTNEVSTTLLIPPSCGTHGLMGSQGSRDASLQRRLHLRHYPALYLRAQQMLTRMMTWTCSFLTQVAQLIGVKPLLGRTL